MQEGALPGGRRALWVPATGEIAQAGEVGKCIPLHDLPAQWGRVTATEYFWPCAGMAAAQDLDFGHFWAGRAASWPVLGRSCAHGGERAGACGAAAGLLRAPSGCLTLPQAPPSTCGDCFSSCGSQLPFCLITPVFSGPLLGSSVRLLKGLPD